MHAGPRSWVRVLALRVSFCVHASWPLFLITLSLILPSSDQSRICIFLPLRYNLEKLYFTVGSILRTFRIEAEL
jgi:hypothetical protein